MVTINGFLPSLATIDGDLLPLTQRADQIAIRGGVSGKELTRRIDSALNYLERHCVLR
jgi:hypothetical protein